jgi:carboxypeptidase Q
LLRLLLLHITKSKQTDYPANLTGKIALVSRGNCTFIEKSARSSRAGAVGTVLYNNVPTGIAGMTLGTDPSPIGPPVPILGVSRDDGLAWVQLIKSGTTVNAVMNVQTVIVDAIT